MGVTMKGKDFDPAALLIAIISVAAAPLLTPGPWDKLNTVIAVVVLAIVAAYSLTRTSQISMNEPQRVAVSLVIGIIISVVIAWPIQLILISHWRIYHIVKTHAELDANAISGRASDIAIHIVKTHAELDANAISGRASDIAIEVGLVVALIIWVWLWRRSVCCNPNQDPTPRDNEVTGRISKLEQENERLKKDIETLERKVPRDVLRGILITFHKRPVKS
jgi:hypothetical protein